MNESTAGKKAQDYLKIFKSSNKKFNETAKKLKNEEKKSLVKNALSKEEYKKRLML